MIQQQKKDWCGFPLIVHWNFYLSHAWKKTFCKLKFIGDRYTNIASSIYLEKKDQQYKGGLLLQDKQTDSLSHNNLKLL